MLKRFFLVLYRLAMLPLMLFALFALVILFAVCAVKCIYQYIVTGKDQLENFECSTDNVHVKIFDITEIILFMK